MTNWDEYLYYDPTSPSFLRWKVDRGKSKVVKAGDVAGALMKEGRWSFILSANGENKRRYNHRIIYEMFYGKIQEGFEIDHLDGNPLNNLDTNLRAVDRSTNSRNVKMTARNTSGIVGVSYSETSGYAYWTASWKDLKGKSHFRYFSVKKLGYSEALELACKARSEAIQSLNQQGAGYTERHGK